MNEFKLQFQPNRIVGGSQKKRDGLAGKHYVAAFVQGNRVVHESRKQHKRATDAILYSHMVIARYQLKAVVAFQQWLDGASTAPLSTAAPLSEENHVPTS